MAIANGYTTLAVVRVQLGITTAGDTTKDAQIEQAVEAVSRLIDEYCHRHFYTTAEDEIRYYTAQTGDIVFIEDDIISVTSLLTDDDGDRTYSTTWTATDYDLMPYNQARYEWIEITPMGDYSFPDCNKGVKITGKFGYCAAADVPAQITEACILQTCRVFKRVTEAPFGVSGGSGMGTAIAIAKFDPDVELLLKPFVRVF